MEVPDLATKSSKSFGTARWVIIHLRTARSSSTKSGSPGAALLVEAPALDPLAVGCDASVALVCCEVDEDCSVLRPQPADKAKTAKNITTLLADQ